MLLHRYGQSAECIQWPGAPLFAELEQLLLREVHECLHLSGGPLEILYGERIRAHAANVQLYAYLEHLYKD